MGEVYRARDTRLERMVAIKVLPHHLSSNPDLKQRFEREARSISSLNHSRICILHDVGHQDGVDFLVMEYLDGETLVERLRKEPLPLKEALRIGIEVCEALEAAQRVGIVHRDLKPGNIMLTKSGVKLMDFGLAKTAATTPGSQSASAPLLSAAKTMSEATPLSPLTTAGTVIGTIQYMAPEQIEGKEADARSDLFALGAVTRPMFGCLAIYVKDKIALILRDKPTNTADNGVWLATTEEHHQSLRGEFPNMRSIQVLGKPVTGWQVLPVDAPDFESSALRACELVLAGDPRIGKIPGARASKSSRVAGKSP